VSLVCVAHGTRFAPGNAVAVDVARQAGSVLGVPAAAAYVELCAPAFADVAAATREPAVAVPLLLSTGFHVRVDLPAAVAGTPVRLAPPLGPSPLLATAQVDRLREVGAAPGRPVLLVAAGSRDPLALPDLHAARDLLADAWGGPVDLAALSGPLPRPAEAVTPDHAVSPYLLAPGFFADRARREGAPALVADVIGSHPAVARLVAQRYAEALSPAGGPPPRACAAAP
jgi:sirohydrochlorin ferrochelatase